MKMKRRLLSILLVLCVTLILVPTILFAQQTDSCPSDASCTHEAAIGTTHYDTLSDAVIAAKGQEIRLLKSIEINEPIVITSDTVINGANPDGVFKITPSATASSYGPRMGLFHMNSDSVTLTIKNVELINKNANGKWADASGISVRASNQNVNLDNVTMDTSHYCLFVGVPGSENEDINDVTININNSRLTGYAAIYYRTNSATNLIMRPVLNVTNSELIGRGYSGYSNDFSTIVFNGTRYAKAFISNSFLSNSFNATNADANESIIQFNCYGAYEENAVITISNSTIKTKNTTAAPNVIDYTAGENLNVGNKVIVDHLTLMVDEYESNLIRVMRNNNELVATGKELDKVLSMDLPSYGDKPGGSTSEERVPLIVDGDTVLVPINTTLTSDAVVPENVTVLISEGSKLSIAEGVKLIGSSGAKLVVQGSIEGLNNANLSATYTWKDNSWVIDVESVTLDKNEITMQKGATELLVATISPDNADNKTISWKSDDPNIAKVDSEGKVTAVNPGNATITAKVKDKEAICNVTVYEIEKPQIPTESVGSDVATIVVDKKAETVLTDSVKDLIENIDNTTAISDETKEIIKSFISDGAVISIEPEIKAVDNKNIDKEVLTKIEETLGSKDEVAQYFELSMNLIVNGESIGPINELTGKVQFTITLDESLIEKGRTFYMIRYHEDGSIEKIEGLLEGNQFTFETDKFSTYALAYTQISETNKGVDTGDPTNTTTLITLMGLAVVVAGGTLVSHKKYNK